MNKLIIFFTVFVTACASTNIFNDNKDCIGIDEFKVFQALDGGALAHECTFAEGCSTWNQLVFLSKQRGIDYYDGLIVKAPNKKCAIRDGVYRYTTKQEISKTVPVIRFDYKNEPKTEEEMTERLQDYYQDVYHVCLDDFESNKEKKDEKFCGCYADTFVSLLLDIYAGEETQEDYKGKFDKDVKKNCGKLPSFLKNQ